MLSVPIMYGELETELGRCNQAILMSDPVGYRLLFGFNNLLEAIALIHGFEGLLVDLDAIQIARR